MTTYPLTIIRLDPKLISTQHLLVELAEQPDADIDRCPMRSPPTINKTLSRPWN